MSLFSNFTVTVTVTEIFFKDKFSEIIINKNILSESGIIVDYYHAILNSQLLIKSCLAAKKN